MKCKKCSHEGDPITTVEPFPAGSVQVDQEDRDAALARLAELEKQEPAYLLTPDGKCYAYGSTQPLSAGHADATLLKLYTAAGASPVEPSQAQPPAPSDAAREYMTGYSDGKEWAQTSQAVDCRTCEYMWIDVDLEKATSKESCARPGVAVCINGSLHKPAPAVVLWRTE